MARSQHWKAYLLLTCSVAFVVFAGLSWLRYANWRIYVVAANPAGDQIITHTYNDSRFSDGGLQATRVRDAFGGRVLHQIPDINWPYPGMLHWWADGQGISGVEELPDRTLRSISIRFDGDSTRVENGVASSELLYSRIDKLGQEIRICKTQDSERLYVEVRDHRQEVIERVEYGKGEMLFAFCPKTEWIVVVAIPPTNAAAKTVLTDGKQPTYVAFDSVTGKMRWQTAGVQASMDGPTSCVAVKNASTGRFELQDTEQEQRVVWDVPAAETPVYFDGRLLLSRSDRGSRGKSVLITTDIVSEERKEIEIPPSNRIVARADQVWLDTHKGELVRLDLTTGAFQRLATARPAQALSGGVMWTGFPIIGCLWLAWLWWRPDCNPFAGMLCLLVCFALAFLIWWQVAGRYFPAFGRWCDSLTQLSSGTSIVIGMLWLSTLRAFDGKAVSIAILGCSVAVVVSQRVIRLDAHAFEFLLVGGAILFWQVLGLSLFMYRFGRIRYRDSEVAASSQVSLRQIFITFTLTAILLAALRTVEVPSGTRWLRVGWSMLFGTVFSVCCLSSLWASLRMRNVILSLCACMLSAGVLAYGSWKCCESMLGFDVGDRTLMVYCQPVVAALVVWLTLQLGKRAGFDLQSEVVKQS